jgi:cytochrome c-type biogenesis protein CcmH/NrfF
MNALLQAVALLAITQGHTGGEDVMAPARELQIDPGKLVSLTQAQKSYAKEIGDEIVCLCGTCPRFTVANCDCGWAAQSMDIIRVALTEGKTREQIHEAYEKVYGSKAFPKPPGALGDATWLIPYVGGIAALAAMFAWGVRALRRRPAAAVASASDRIEEGDLDEDRDRLKRELEDLD